MSEGIYAIGDIHGELNHLKSAIKKIENDGGSDARIVFLGDYVDRGPDSKGVIDLLMNGQAVDKNWICLSGNHDQLFSLFLRDCHAQMTVHFHWLNERLGGQETLASYNVKADENNLEKTQEDASAAVPVEHLEFIDNLPCSHQEDGLFFVHAGIRPGVPLAQQTEQDLLWIRDEFLEDKRSHPHLVIHGHTPVTKARHYGNRVNLDTGSGYGHELSAAVFEGNDCWLLTDTGRLQLQPEPL